MAKRLVAIVGRPNVGKSALFNRLAGRRIAIVHAESGVTRDRLMSKAAWGEDRFDVVDTGGIGEPRSKPSPEGAEGGIRSQVEAALEDAAAALLVVDAAAGLLPLDQAVAGMLRRRGVPTFVAANKCDRAQHDIRAAEFTALGFPVFSVSALHGRGLDALMRRILAVLPAGGRPTREDPLKVAVVGRPNVGKSSYVNRVLRDERVLVSDTPGTTRDSVDVPFVLGRGEQARHCLLIDTAGMRRRGKVRGAVENYSLLRAERSILRADVVAVMLEAASGPTALDKRIAARVIEAGKGCVLLVNKWDLAATTERQRLPEIRNALPFAGFCPVVFVSAKSGYRIRQSVEVIDGVAARMRTQIPTGILNRALQAAVLRSAPPGGRGGRPTRFFYAAQVGGPPLRVRVFVNDPGAVRAAYREYLIRALRTQFGLEGVPVVLEFRARHAPDGTGKRPASRRRPRVKR